MIFSWECLLCILAKSFIPQKGKKDTRIIEKIKEGNSCYYIESNFKLALAGSSEKVYISYCNIICVKSFFQDSISHFSRRVRSLPGSMSPFDRPGRNTFFVPVDSAFEDLSVELLTQDVVRAHVVPGEVNYT